MTECEIREVARYLEGEGSFIVKKSRHGGKTWIYPNVSAFSTDLDVLQWLQSVAGGIIYGPHIRVGRKPCYVWRVQRQDDAFDLMQRVLPYMGARRTEQIETVLSNIETARASGQAYRFSDDHRQKISDALRGRSRSPEARAAISRGRQLGIARRRGTAQTQ